jgi:hypothetical protein
MYVAHRILSALHVLLARFTLTLLLLPQVSCSVTLLTPQAVADEFTACKAASHHNLYICHM